MIGKAFSCLLKHNSTVGKKVHELATAFMDFYKGRLLFYLGREFISHTLKRIIELENSQGKGSKRSFFKYDTILLIINFPLQLN